MFSGFGMECVQPGGAAGEWVSSINRLGDRTLVRGRRGGRV